GKALEVIDQSLSVFGDHATASAACLAPFVFHQWTKIGMVSGTIVKCPMCRLVSTYACQPLSCAMRQNQTSSDMVAPRGLVKLLNIGWSVGHVSKTSRLMLVQPSGTTSTSCRPGWSSMCFTCSTFGCRALWRSASQL